MLITLNAALAGLGVGAVYGLIALGYTVVYNTTRVFNLAQGDLVMIGVMGSWIFLAVLRWPQPVVFVLVVVVVALIACIEERYVVRPFLKRSDGAFGWFIATLAFSLIIETIAIVWYGNRPINPVPSFISTLGWNIGRVSIAPKFVVALAALIITTIGVEWFYSRTWSGLAMRGIADDREIARLRGIDSTRLGRLAFAISGAIAGVAGFVLAPITFSDPTIGLAYTIKGFIALAIGGFGSIRGALVGALSLGVAEQVFDRYWNSTYEMLADLAFIAIVFGLRPSGLFPERMV